MKFSKCDRNLSLFIDCLEQDQDLTKNQCVDLNCVSVCKQTNQIILIHFIVER
jgi:hypothetical protein